MITSLTPEQEAKVPEYRAKWLARGLATDQFTLEEATEIIHRFQRLVLQTKETPVALYPCPDTAWKAVAKHANCEGCAPIIPFQDGSFFSSSFSFYDFFISEGLVKLEPALQERFEAWTATHRLGFIYPLDDICIISQKPTRICLNEAEKLHSESGKALEYASGWGFYALNGVRVPEYLAMTPSHELDIEFFKKEKNADIKAEFVRKYGVERMLDLGKQVDSFSNYDQEEQPWWWKSEYELWDMAVLFPGLAYQPYLKMKNQTTGIWHVEAVSPACRTVPDAIKERFGGRDMKIVAIA